MGINLTIDGREIVAEPGMMIIEVTDKELIPVPRFCYHPKLSIAANCRMCLVEVKNISKPVPACATPITEGMIISTKSQMTRDAQKSVMEFLLINHPLDCPICDQGGECELQDLALSYGKSYSRFDQKKRTGTDYDLGPLVATDMTRCIHCTRCVRFGSEITNEREIGGTGRGEATSIGSYLATNLHSSMSGNIIDICPVGALTSKPLRATYRSWELEQAAGVSFHYLLGPSLYWQYINDSIKRTAPREHQGTNDQWLTDKDRFSFLSLTHSKRLLSPKVKRGNNWFDVSWDEAIMEIGNHLQEQHLHDNNNQICGLIHPNSTYEEAWLFSKFIRSFGSQDIEHRLSQQNFSSVHQKNIFVADKPEDFFNQSCLVVGDFIDIDEPFLDYQLNQARKKGINSYHLGSYKKNSERPFTSELLSPIQNLPSLLEKFVMVVENELSHDLSGAEFDFIQKLKNNDRVNILLAPKMSSSPFLSDIIYYLEKLSKLLKGVFLRLTYGNSVACTLAGAIPFAQHFSSKLGCAYKNREYSVFDHSFKSLILFNVEPEDAIKKEKIAQLIKKTPFVVAMTSFDHEIYNQFADIMLPINGLGENCGHHINMFGQHQESHQAIQGPGESKMGWEVLMALLKNCNLSPEHVQKFEDIFQSDVINKYSVAATLEPKSQQKSEPTKLPYLALLKNPYQNDQFSRKTNVLQETKIAKLYSSRAWISPQTAAHYGISDGDLIEIKQSKSYQVYVRLEKLLSDHMIYLWDTSLDSECELDWGFVELRKI